jgi:glycerol-3-phosphate O-acyltransferase/dihydroxyacetone phosphate acyltransferase
MIYNFLKIIVRLTLRIFYRKFTVNNKQNTPSKGPLIIVANHPNTLMDPVVIASFLKQQIYFLTNGSVFNTPFKKKLLGVINMIPIYRKEDVKEGEKTDNKAVFEKCYEFLAKGGTLIIFPEGYSVNERNLRKLKTGTARIALGAEAEYDFKLGVKILTIGLNYSEAPKFRSDLFIDVDKPIEVKSYQAAYEKDEFKAVEILTDEMRERLENHIIVSQSDEDDALARQVEAIYKPILAEEVDLPKKQRDFEISKEIVEAVKYFSLQQPERVEQLRTDLEIYQNSLNRLHLKDAEFTNKSAFRSLSDNLLSFFYLLIGFPFYLFGLIHNYIPYIIPSKVAHKLTKEIEYIAPMMMIIGTITFPFFYALEIYIFQYFTQLHWLWVVGYGIFLPISGFFVLYYWSFLRDSRNMTNFLAIFGRRKAIVERLSEMRENIILDLELAKKEYLDRKEAME